MKIKRCVIAVMHLIIFMILLSACEVLTDLDDKIDEVQATANAVETSFQKGLELIETGQAIITNVEGSGIGQTAIAAATDFEESGVIETAKSIATDKGPELLQTVQSFATDQVPKLKSTAQAIATHFPPPFDLPVMEGEKSEIRSSTDNVSYRINADVQDVIEFYNNEMPKSGWTFIESASVVNQNGALFHYENRDRKAVLAINIDPDTKNTIVKITIQDG